MHYSVEVSNLQFNNQSNIALMKTLIIIYAERAEYFDCKWLVGSAIFKEIFVAGQNIILKIGFGASPRRDQAIMEQFICSTPFIYRNCLIVIYLLKHYC